VKVRRVDFYPDDWIAGTVGLTHHERSVYISVIAGIWAIGGPVPIDYLRRICPGRGMEKGLRGLVEKGKVSLGGSLAVQFVSQTRALTELSRSTSRIEQAHENGAKGGRPNNLTKPDGSSDQKANSHTVNSQQSTRRRSADADSVCARAKPKATTLPEDWEPGESDRMYAEERGLNPDEMLPEWRNYWCYEGGKNVKRVDWSLTWKDRCRTLAKRQGGNGQARSGRNDASRGGLVAAMRELWLEENDGCLPH
jgi:hypothetical protein